MDVENQESQENGDKPLKNGDKRDDKGRFVEGYAGGPGRPKGSGAGLKDYDRQKFIAMSDEQKEKFLKLVSPELRYRMAEGNPQNDLTSGGGPLQVVVPQAVAETFNIHESNSETRPGYKKQGEI